MAETEKPEQSRADKFFSRTGWWYVAAAIVLIVAAGLVWVLLPSGRDPAPAPGASPPPWTGDGGWNDTGWSDLGCAGTTGTSAVPTSAPRVSWIAIGQVSSPTSPEYGPTRTDGPVRSCFQHSPTGALMAATAIVESTSDPSTAARVLTSGMTPGPGRDLAIAAVVSDSTPGTASPAGFNFGACQPDRCQIGLLIAGAGVYGQLPLSMVWREGDWRIDGSGGAIQPTPTTVMPSGYIPWGTTT